MCSVKPVGVPGTPWEINVARIVFIMNINKVLGLVTVLASALTVGAAAGALV